MSSLPIRSPKMIAPSRDIWRRDLIVARIVFLGPNATPFLEEWLA